MKYETNRVIIRNAQIEGTPRREKGFRVILEICRPGASKLYVQSPLLSTEAEALVWEPQG